MASATRCESIEVRINGSSFVVKVLLDQDRTYGPSGETFKAIATFVLGSTHVPEPVLERSADLLLDTLGVAAASTQVEAGRIARDASVLLYGTSDPAYATPLLFDGRIASIPGAAYAIATQIDNLDAHDGFNLAKGHVGVAVVPSLFALAAQLPDLSGREALVALTIAYEIAGRAGIALHASSDDYHTSGAWNALGVAAIAGRLRGLDEDTLRQALGIAEFHGPRSQMMREIANPTMLHDGSGWGAMAGLSATITAERGFVGAPAITLEGSEVAHIWQDLGSVWQLPDHYIKPYPVCRWAHPVVDAAKQLRARYSIDLDQISSIDVFTFGPATRLYAQTPSTASQAQYSLPWALATMLYKGAVTPNEILDLVNDQTISALIGKTQMNVDSAYDCAFPARRIARMRITCNDGQSFDSGPVEASTDAQITLDRDAVTAKFENYAAPVLGVPRATSIRRAVYDLLEPKSRLQDLARLLIALPD